MQQPTQIFDLLSGNVNPVRTDVNPNGFAAAESDGPAFGDLLLGLAGHGGFTGNEELAQPIESSLLIVGTKEEAGPENSNPEAAVGMESGLVDLRLFRTLGAPVQLMSSARQSESPEQTALNNRPELIDILNGNNQSAALNPIDKQGGRMFEAATPQQPVAENVAEFNNSLRNELRLDFPLPKNTLNNLTYREAVDIVPGKYEILSQTIENSTITLTVKNPGSKDAPIRLSLPVELFDTGPMANLADGAARRIALESGFDRALQLRNLFDKLNLKGIEVKPLSGSTGESAELIVAKPESKFLEIKLIPQESEKFVPVLRPLNRTELNASRESVGTRATNGKENSEQRLPLELDSRIDPTLRPAARAGVSERTAGSLIRSAIPQQSGVVFDLLMKGGGDTVLEQQRSAFDPIVVDRAQADLPVDNHKTEARPVRFVLPDNLKTMLKPNGNSVTIKIDPEHLGPARLTLSMHDNILKARIMVENVHIRSVVEASLDHLVDQLSKADIKVDQIEVLLSGNSFRDDFNGRRNFRHSSKPSQLRHHQTADLDMTAPTAPAQYVGSNGVNILA